MTNNFDAFSPREPEIDYTKIKNGGELCQLCGDEGEKWAKAFSQFYKLHKNVDIDEEFVFIWFANVIETTKDIVSRE